MEAELAAVESAVVGVPDEEAGAEAGALLAAVACHHDIGEGAEGGQRAGVVLRGGEHVGGREEVDGDVKGGERLRQAGPSVSQGVGRRGEMRDAVAATARVLGPQEARR